MLVFNYFMNILIIYLHLKLTCAYVIKVTLKNDDVIEELTEYEVVDGDVAPFSSPHSYATENSDNLVTSDAALVTGFIGNTRYRRSADVADVCVNNSKDTSLTKRAVAVEKGETFHLFCHSCKTDRHERYASRQWIKLNYAPNAEGLYHIYEVVSEMRSDEKRNRISQTLDHTLTIRHAKMSDAGSYFCKPPDKNNFIDMHLSWRDLQDYIANTSRLLFFFHVDVINIDILDVIDVSNDSSITPLQPEVVPDLNIVVDTRWHSWSKCSVCDDEGMHKRIGICIIKKYDQNYKIQNTYLEHILGSSGEGIPCKSQFLVEFEGEKWLQRPNQIQMDDCYVPCPPGKAKRKRRSISQKDIRKNFDDEIKSKTAVNQEKKVKAGSYILLTCPGSSLTTSVVWVNGTELLPLKAMKRDTQNRITYDVIGNMHFEYAILSDTGVYTCWLEEKMIRKFTVEVVPDNTTYMLYYMVYLCYSFVFDFLVFTILACVKICARKGQKRRKKKKKSKHDADDKETSKKDSSGKSNSKKDSLKKDNSKKDSPKKDNSKKYSQTKDNSERDSPKKGKPNKIIVQKETAKKNIQNKGTSKKGAK